MIQEITAMEMKLTNRFQDITTVQVEGLDNASFIDKTDNLAVKTQSGALSFAGETDSVYTPVGGPKAPVTVKQGGRTVYTVVRDNLDDVVVWNPWEAKAKAMPDFGPDDGWRNMICVEAGAVKGFQKLEAGDAFEGAQVITAGL